MKRWQELVHVSSMLRLLKLRFTSVLFCYQRWQVLCCGRNLFFYFILYAQLHNSHATSALNIAPYCNTRLRRKPARHNTIRTEQNRIKYWDGSNLSQIKCFNTICEYYLLWCAHIHICCEKRKEFGEVES